MVLPIVWAILGVATVVAAIRSRKSRRAMVAGRWILATLFVAAGAFVNLGFLLTGDDYAGFADAAYIPFVRDTWDSLVVPNVAIFISILIAFEAIVGVMVLLGRRRTQAALLAMMAFHVALLSFGFGFFAWSTPMLGALALLLRAELREPVREDGVVSETLRRAA